VLSLGVIGGYTMKADEQMEWCVVKLGSDLNWWIAEANWLPLRDGDEPISILDPRQVDHMFELLEPLQEFGLQKDIVERAFSRFSIEKEIEDGHVRLLYTTDEFSSDDGSLFALPNASNEGNGSYAEFLDHITAIRVKFLNEIGNFVQKLSVDELEEAVREIAESTQITELPLHLFYEIMAILEYSPIGFDASNSDEEEDAEGWRTWNKESMNTVEEINTTTF
jgi:hypothetical protein